MTNTTFRPFSEWKNIENHWPEGIRCWPTIYEGHPAITNGHLMFVRELPQWPYELHEDRAERYAICPKSYPIETAVAIEPQFVFDKGILFSNGMTLAEHLFKAVVAHIPDAEWFGLSNSVIAVKARGTVFFDGAAAFVMPLQVKPPNEIAHLFENQKREWYQLVTTEENLSFDVVKEHVKPYEFYESKEAAIDAAIEHAERRVEDRTDDLARYKTQIAKARKNLKFALKEMENLRTAIEEFREREKF